MDDALGLAWAGTLALGLSLYFAGTLLRPVMHWRRSREEKGVDRGPAPGYCLYPPEAVDRKRVALEAGWLPWSLETFYIPNRKRIVLTVCPEHPALLDSDKVVSMLAASSEAMLEVADVDVVVVEAVEQEPGPSLSKGWIAIRSRDGRGWSGQEEGAKLVIEGPR